MEELEMLPLSLPLFKFKQHVIFHLFSFVCFIEIYSK